MIDRAIGPRPRAPIPHFSFRASTCAASVTAVCRTTLAIASAIGIAVAVATVPAPAATLSSRSKATVASRGGIAAMVSRAVRPVMLRYGIPGMAVGVTVHGRHYVFDYGVASKATGRHVDARTLFEIGSITKTVTGTLAAYAVATGAMSLSDPVSERVSELRGTAFDRVPLVDLGTHTSGGLPLQFPDDVTSDAGALRYYERWRPVHPAGEYRLYSNTGIMLLGLAAARAMHGEFSALVERDVFGPLRLENTYLHVDGAATARYAQGYRESGRPIRMAPGPLAAEAYGIRTTASDLLRYVDANLAPAEIGGALGRAIASTHTGYDRLGPMTQDFVWEQLAYPTTLETLLAGNSAHVLFDDDRVAPIRPPSPPAHDVLIDKTGSTNGFAAYVAFVPAREIGIVILANRSYPIPARVAAAYAILDALASPT